MTDPSEALAHFARTEAAPLIASLTRRLGDFDLAEEAVQDAIVEAMRHWPADGVPHQPGAWLRVAAQRKAIDRLRREALHRNRLASLAMLDAGEQASDVEPIADDRLMLLFMCCHPALSREAQVALTLRSLLGLTTAQLARAFLASEATMTKRIARAKRKIVEARIPLAIPSGADAEARLGEVLASIYLMFNEGYLSAGGESHERAQLAADAEWLAGLLRELLPDEPEVIGLLSLIRLHQARRSARFDSAGDLILLKDQDRSLWDRSAIDGALELLADALRKGQAGFYQAQAAIVGCHATARSWEETNWPLILTLYDQLLALTDSPVVALSRAVALQHVRGPLDAYAALDDLEDRLDSYHLYHATRADLLRTLGRAGEATLEDRRAAQLTRNPAELRLLRHRIDSGFPPPLA